MYYSSVGLERLFCIEGFFCCSDGGSLCGLFIAVHNAIQQLNTDGGLDVFTVVRQLQIRRPELCNSIVSLVLVMGKTKILVLRSTKHFHEPLNYN